MRNKPTIVPCFHPKCPFDPSPNARTYACRGRFKYDCSSHIMYQCYWDGHSCVNCKKLMDLEAEKEGGGSDSESSTDSDSDNDDGRAANNEQSSGTDSDNDSVEDGVADEIEQAKDLVKAHAALSCPDTLSQESPAQETSTGLGTSSAPTGFPSAATAAPDTLPASLREEPRPNSDHYEGFKPSRRSEYSTRNRSINLGHEYWLAHCVVEFGRATCKIVWQSNDEAEVLLLESFYELERRRLIWPQDERHFTLSFDGVPVTTILDEEVEFITSTVSCPSAIAEVEETVSPVRGAIAMTVPSPAKSTDPSHVVQADMIDLTDTSDLNLQIQDAPVSLC